MIVRSVLVRSRARARRAHVHAQVERGLNASIAFGASHAHLVNAVGARDASARGEGDRTGRERKGDRDQEGNGEHRDGGAWMRL